jgi:8-oxo-dGTP pyrophosphatase MutT (NUDIX family)
MAEKRYSAAGGIVIHAGRMLVLDRPTRKEVRLPKGHVETGESTLEAALRETAEESGYADLAVVADLGSQVVEFALRGDHVTRTEHYYLLRLNSERRMQRNAEDAAQFKPLWLPLSDAVARLTYAAEQEMARRAIAAVVDR